MLPRDVREAASYRSTHTARIVRTGQAGCRTTWSAVEPKNIRSTAPRPCIPITIRSRPTGRRNPVSAHLVDGFGRDNDRVVDLRDAPRIDCDACVHECPVEAIFPEWDVPAEWSDYIALNAEMAAKLPAITEKKAPLDEPNG